mmetsp:Transcript_9775/g.14992  ORF Transcript_9775/g.14992 Transcript_9775/m.14992 type:complete len:401 (+) Transcript_9775:118-1320(+)|eukprot:CAMPEP_0113940736 /NCGR_PEP_ID=MMETSP1339-20121228/6812_1 /TAXON_ID=94617 /ORGANISM="Fibrocapsa japonica" /LENGTH=400 /DNA_ID=CAMNT_0000944677 /DNA_START=98 /DNA_END=1300 /DNA_ORIENTATION=+ /assembly_acc=CAM_ASM_000762
MTAKLMLPLLLARMVILLTLSHDSIGFSISPNQFQVRTQTHEKALSKGTRTQDAGGRRRAASISVGFPVVGNMDPNYFHGILDNTKNEKPPTLPQPVSHKVVAKLTSSLLPTILLTGKNPRAIIIRWLSSVASSLMTEQEMESLSKSWIGQKTRKFNEMTMFGVKSHQVLNLVFIVCALCSFASGMHFMDAEDLRGWNPEEIMWHIPLEVTKMLHDGLHHAPRHTKSFVHMAFFIIGDWLGQVQWGKKNLLDFDLMELLRNGVIFFACGPVIHYACIGSGATDTLLPLAAENDQLWKVGVEVGALIIAEAAMYIGVMELLRGYSKEQMVESFSHTILPIIQHGATFWSLAYLTMYSVIPEIHRVLWVNGCELAWMSIVAYLASCEAESISKSTVMDNKQE